MSAIVIVIAREGERMHTTMPVEQPGIEPVSVIVASETSAQRNLPQTRHTDTFYLFMYARLRGTVLSIADHRAVSRENPSNSRPNGTIVSINLVVRRILSTISPRSSRL